MLDKIQQLKDEIQNLHVSSAAEVEDLRIKYLSKKGAISQLMNDFRTVAPELKRELGQKLNELKNNGHGPHQHPARRSGRLIGGKGDRS